MGATFLLTKQVTLNKLLRSARPDRVIIEPTGLGHPAKILQQLEKDFNGVLSLRGVITIVDASAHCERWHSQNETYRDQINVADIVVLNKVDLVSDGQLSELLVWADGLFPAKQKVVTAERGQFDLSLLNHKRGSKYTPLFPNAHSAEKHHHHGEKATTHHHHGEKVTTQHHHEEKATTHHHHAEKAKTVSFKEQIETAFAKGQPAFFLGANDNNTSYGWVFPPGWIFNKGKVLAIFQDPHLNCQRAKGAFRFKSYEWRTLNVTPPHIDEQDSKWDADSRLELIFANSKLDNSDEPMHAQIMSRLLLAVEKKLE